MIKYIVSLVLLLPTGPEAVSRDEAHRIFKRTAAKFATLGIEVKRLRTRRIRREPSAFLDTGLNIQFKKRDFWQHWVERHDQKDVTAVKYALLPPLIFFNQKWLYGAAKVCSYGFGQKFPVAISLATPTRTSGGSAINMSIVGMEHELGHVFGAWHDIEELEDGNFATIMHPSALRFAATDREMDFSKTSIRQMRACLPKTRGFH